MRGLSGGSLGESRSQAASRRCSEYPKSIHSDSWSSGGASTRSTPSIVTRSLIVLLGSRSFRVMGTPFRSLFASVQRTGQG
jgi:hypothetical protein